MRVLRSIYDFITGGSVAAPVGLGCAIGAGLLVPAHERAGVFAAIVALAFIAGTFERPS